MRDGVVMLVENERKVGQGGTEVWNRRDRMGARRAWRSVTWFCHGEV